MSEVTTTKKPSKLANFWKGVKTEFRKIIWPDRDTMLKQLLAVVIVSVIVGAIIALLDFGFQELIDLLTQLSF